MKSAAFCVLTALFLQYTSAEPNHLEAPRWKSFDDAQNQCTEYLQITQETLNRYSRTGYPDEPSVRVLINCILISVNAWNETEQTVQDHVFRWYFLPPSNETDYEKNTQTCLIRTESCIRKSERLSRAYNSFICYYRNYGGISTEKQIVPYTEEEILQTLVDTMNIIPHSQNSLIDYCQGRVLEVPEYEALAYAYTVRLGWYNRTTGVDLRKFYVQFGRPELLCEETRQCVLAVADRYCSEPDRIFNTILRCIAKYIPVIRIVSTSAARLVGNVATCGVPPA